MRYNVAEEILQQLGITLYSNKVENKIKCTNCNKEFEKSFPTQHCCDEICSTLFNIKSASFTSASFAINTSKMDLITDNFGVQGMSRKRNENKSAKVNSNVNCPVCKKDFVKTHEGQSLCSDKCKTVLKGMK
jgi:ribosomal protein L37AE/L43A